MIATLTLAAALAVPSPVGPETRYDPRIPTLKQVTGHELGEEITTPDEIGAYLAGARGGGARPRARRRVRAERGGPAAAACWSSAARSASRGSTTCRGGCARSPTRARSRPPRPTAWCASCPAVVWLLHAVHGNEISSSDAALALAHHLLAAQGDPGPTSCGARRSCSSTPSRTRTAARASWPRTALGRAARPDPEPASAEHDEPWPGGRANHYLFDMNRDWFAQIAARDPRAAAPLPRVVPARERRPARDGRRLDVLLRAAREAVQPALLAGAAGLARRVRPRDRRPVRRGGTGLLRARGLRQLLPRLRRVLADGATAPSA